MKKEIMNVLKVDGAYFAVNDIVSIHTYGGFGNLPSVIEGRISAIRDEGNSNSSYILIDSSKDFKKCEYKLSLYNILDIELLK